MARSYTSATPLRLELTEVDDLARLRHEKRGGGVSLQVPDRA